MLFKGRAKVARGRRIKTIANTRLVDLGPDTIGAAITESNDVVRAIDAQARVAAAAALVHADRAALEEAEVRRAGAAVEAAMSDELASARRYRDLTEALFAARTEERDQRRRLVELRRMVAVLTDLAVSRRRDEMRVEKRRVASLFRRGLSKSLRDAWKASAPARGGDRLAFAAGPTPFVHAGRRWRRGVLLGVALGRVTPRCTSDFWQSPPSARQAPPPVICGSFAREQGASGDSWAWRATAFAPTQQDAQTPLETISVLAA